MSEVLFQKQDRPVSTDHKVLGKISFEIESRKIRDIDEAVADAGSMDAVLAVYQSSRDTMVKNSVRVIARDWEVAEGTDASLYPSIVEELVAAGQKAARDYEVSRAERSPSKARKDAKVADEIEALVNSNEEFTKEDLLRILALRKA